MVRTALLSLGLLIAVAALCDAYWDHDHHESEEHDDRRDDHDDHIWRFSFDSHSGAYSYVDRDGHVKGFFIDIMQDVCKRAHKRCHFLIDDEKHCWKAHHGVEHPGVGLLAGWYDGCIGYWPTPERQNSFDFTASFSSHPYGALYYRAGEDHGDKNDVTGRTIGFTEGWGIGKVCFSRHTGFTGNHENEYTSSYFSSQDALVKALQEKEVDAIVTSATLDEEKLGVEKASRHLHCTKGGLAVMAHYGNDLIHWWNDAFKHLKDTGRFSLLCRYAKRKYGAHGRIDCVH